MAGKFDDIIRKIENEKRIEAGLEPLPEEEPILDMDESEKIDAEEDNVVHKKAKKKSGILRGIFVFFIVIALCGGFAYIAVAGALDFTGLNKSDSIRDVEIPNGSSTEKIASLLEENDLIDQPLIFRIYSRLAGKDGQYQAGTYSLSANMGYEKLMAVIIAGNKRETATVTIPEGFTISQIAKRLEENKVCTEADFYDALLNETYDFDFFDDIPDAKDGGVYEGRVYRLEGYLFPDTYEFYTNCSGKSVVQKFLSNFNSKFTAEMREEIDKRGLSLDEVVVMASVTQKEAATSEDMPKVTRILYNRLESDYTRLECDSTALYLKDLMPNVVGMEIISEAYNTYSRFGLPAGSICNPGLAALKAAVYPSEDAYIKQCYYFANDRVGNTYYSKTFAQHEAYCRKYGIGAYG